MTDLRNTLQPLIDAEQRSPGPSPELVDALWSRIAADHQRGALPDLDVPPPARPRLPYLWLALGLLAAGLLAASLHLLRPTAAPPPPEPAPPIHTTTPPLAPLVPELPAPIAAPVPETPPPAEPSSQPATPMKPRKARPASTTGEQDTFAAELRLLAQGQAALSRDDHSEALRIADRYHKTYPSGHFTEDRDALRVLALCESLSTKGKPAAGRFLRDYPRSIHASRIREACKLPVDWRRAPR